MVTVLVIQPSRDEKTKHTISTAAAHVEVTDTFLLLIAPLIADGVS